MDAKEIAREEAMPPYIIFSDKTLIDMCVKTPQNKYEMLNVSGVGVAKYDKYGQRFLDEIKKYQENNPNAVISIYEEEDQDTLLMYPPEVQKEIVNYFIR
ncbi:MAG: HRDC domain-containing protein [Lachnospiraceae bacterium]|nr:HRDC domain-containing protein [Lachnospiraceae bacterium]